LGCNIPDSERRDKMVKKILLIVSILISSPALIHAAVADYLILQDIDPYKLFTGISGRVFSGPPSKYSQTNTGGVLDAAGHFSEGDTSYEASYTEPGGRWPFVKVEVTNHSDPLDSIKWLLHEVDKEFRTYYGVPDPSYIIKNVDGNTVYSFGSAGWDYRWISGNKVVMIEYHDSRMTKPEPLEVVKAYLMKHPSTLAAMTMQELRSTENKTKWIKDEIERRLWLCDKWFMQLQLQKAKQEDVLQASVKHMEVFLNYREKYFGISAANEKQLLWGYRDKNNGTGIKAKLAEYKIWWAANKDKAINL
jgi:hypothetical protein